MVRQWQELFFGKRYSQTILDDGNPDFLKLAEGYGAVGIRVTKNEDVESVIRESLKVNDKPVVMDFIIKREENVMPMVPAGASLTDMIEGTV
jgi:acetolactate synthase-1/2/3 large subunit